MGQTLSPRLSFMEETPSDDSIAAAIHIKTTMNRKLYEHISNYNDFSDFFEKPVHANLKTINYRLFAQSADVETEKWLSIPTQDINFYNNMEDKLNEWISSLEINELAKIIEKTPRGGTNLLFTPWQRLYIAFICFRPFSTSTSIEITSEQLQEIQRDNKGKKRRIGLGSRYSSMKETVQTINIIALATASGKTSTCLAISNILLTILFENIKKQHTDRCSGIAYSGIENPKTSRMVIICGSGGVHNHWINEFYRLQDEFKRITPEINYEIWDGQSQNHSTKIAYESENTVVFWFLQISKLNEELRKYPEINVAICITDEMTIDTPKEKTLTDKSNVLIRLLPQATPGALKNVTQGNTSWLKEAFGGELISPKWLQRLLNGCDFRRAQTCIEQYCKLMQFMPMGFRNQIRLDLEEIIPKEMNFIYIKSRRGTLNSHLMNSSEDIVPASFNNVLRSKLPIHNIDYENSGMKELNDLLKNNPSIPISHIIERIKKIKDKQNFELVSNPEIKRMVERMEEFSEECPICCTKTDQVQMMTCCSYCVCASCHYQWNKCAFCRTPLANHVGIPFAPEKNCEFMKQETLSSTVFFNTDTNNMQMKNMKLALESLAKHDYKRILLMVNIYKLSGEGVNKFVDTINSNSVINVYDTEFATNGKGNAFKSIKERFDSVEKFPEPIALLCNNNENSGVLVGVDFKSADAVVMVGDIPPKIGTQLIGRVFRPNPSRKHDSIPFIKIYSS